MISRNRWRFLSRFVITLAIALLIASCASGGSATGDAIRQYYDAINAGDADAAAALFAEDAVVVVPTGNTLTGIEAISSTYILFDLENMEKVDFQSEFTVSSDKVLWTQEYTMKDGSSFVSNCEVTLKNGKIVEWVWN